MRQLFSLMLVTLAAAAAAKPLAPRPAASPWAAAEPPTAEQLRNLHRMLPHDGEENLSEEAMTASFEGFLRARGGRLEPMWANHSHAERTAHLQKHHASRMRAHPEAGSCRKPMNA